MSTVLHISFGTVVTLINGTTAYSNLTHPCVSPTTPYDIYIYVSSILSYGVSDLVYAYMMSVICVRRGNVLCKPSVAISVYGCYLTAAGSVHSTTI